MWYQLAQGLEARLLIPSDYTVSSEVANLASLKSIDFEDLVSFQVLLCDS